jgi:DNA invertase Pin-like site-specific DNA recombinase
MNYYTDPVWPQYSAAAVGQIVASVLFGVAQMERENINERIRPNVSAVANRQSITPLNASR